MSGMKTTVTNLGYEYSSRIAAASMFLAVHIFAIIELWFTNGLGYKYSNKMPLLGNTIAGKI